MDDFIRWAVAHGYSAESAKKFLKTHADGSPCRCEEAQQKEKKNE